MLLWMTIAFCWMTVGLACSCGRQGDRAYCRYDVVFRGRPVAEHMVETGPFDFNGVRTYTVEVDEIFRSKNRSVGLTTVNVTTPNNDGMCGVVFTLNTAYVIVANNGFNGLETYLCDGSRGWNSLSDQRKTFLSTTMRDVCNRASKVTPASPGFSRL
ncbi:uncharacterized protein LOC112559836 [Pomacea canaliculata]|uniref:uncharacterized protein LOC112559836 n=1 Tax=Pomacea canaliculata TaxID=400727 RepID=UPI000D732C13|nr:uncharacterized protein LOC112559836 [Pomacea canaliculata]